jgi:hypothetical protein
MRTWIAILALIFAGSTLVLAQVQRLLPKDANLGVLVGQQHPFPLVQINREVLRLAPGGLIFDQHNRSILHTSLPAQAPVLYSQDAAGNVTRVIILRPEELVLLERAAQR